MTLNLLNPVYIQIKVGLHHATDEAYRARRLYNSGSATMYKAELKSGAGTIK